MKYKEWFHDLKTSKIDINNLEPKSKLPDLDYDMWLSRDIFKVDKFYLKKQLIKFNLFRIIEVFYRKLNPL